MALRTGVPGGPPAAPDCSAAHGASGPPSTRPHPFSSVCGWSCGGWRRQGSGLIKWPHCELYVGGRLHLSLLTMQARVAGALHFSYSATVQAIRLRRRCQARPSRSVPCRKIGPPQMCRDGCCAPLSPGPQQTASLRPQTLGVCAADFAVESLAVSEVPKKSMPVPGPCCAHEPAAGSGVEAAYACNRRG